MTKFKNKRISVIQMMKLYSILFYRFFYEYITININDIKKESSKISKTKNFFQFLLVSSVSVDIILKTFIDCLRKRII